jgi:hypothetical protein
MEGHASSTTEHHHRVHTRRAIVRREGEGRRYEGLERGRGRVRASREGEYGAKRGGVRERSGFWRA